MRKQTISGYFVTKVNSKDSLFVNLISSTKVWLNKYTVIKSNIERSKLLAFLTLLHSLNNEGFEGAKINFVIYTDDSYIMELFESDISKKDLNDVPNIDLIMSILAIYEKLKFKLNYTKRMTKYFRSCYTALNSIDLKPMILVDRRLDQTTNLKDII